MALLLCILFFITSRFLYKGVRWCRATVFYQPRTEDDYAFLLQATENYQFMAHPRYHKLHPLVEPLCLLLVSSLFSLLLIPNQPPIGNDVWKPLLGSYQHPNCLRGLDGFCQMGPYHSPDPPSERYYYLNQEEELYFSTGSRIIKEAHLLEVLSTMGEKECICPDRLGLSEEESINFIHYRERWVTIYDAEMKRALVGSPLVKSRVGEWEGEHHESFTVMVTTIGRNLNQTERTLLREENKGKFIILKRIPLEEIKRITLQLSGLNAICFTYCRTTSPS
jgi:hypothetical protein